MLSPKTLPALQSALKDAGLDGWLLYDFRGLNPVAGSLLGIGLYARRGRARERIDLYFADGSLSSLDGGSLEAARSAETSAVPG